MSKHFDDDNMKKYGRMGESDELSERASNYSQEKVRVSVELFSD